MTGAGPVRRCPWADNSPLEMAYHDREWGRPLREDQALFELMVLEYMQSGLSWHLVLSRREGMRQAFDGFDPAVIAGYSDERLALLMEDPRVIRNRLKIQALRKNAQAFLQVAGEFGSFSNYLWGFVAGRPVQNAWTDVGQVPSKTALSEAISRDMKRRGFGFMGPTVTYAYLQAAGLVNDHLVSCFCYDTKRTL